MADEDIQKRFEDELTTMEVLTKQLHSQLDKVIMIMIIFGFAFVIMISVLIWKVFA